MQLRNRSRKNRVHRRIMMTQDDLKTISSYEEVNGWVYVSVKGGAFERGEAYGFQMAEKILSAVAEARELIILHTGVEWDFFKTDEISVVNTWMEHLQEEPYNEFLEEMKGMVEGVKKNKEACEKYHGVTLDVMDLVIWNGFEELTDYWFPTVANQIYDKLQGEVATADSNHTTFKSFNSGAGDHCSAFIATGSYTKNGKIVMAHNSFTPFEDGNHSNVITEIVPDQGNHIIMQSQSGYIHSMSDFYEAKYDDRHSLMITETTIGGFNAYNSKEVPEFVRIRYAVQYADSLDSFVEKFWEHNNGGYANTWLVGDTKTNEIMRFEAGLKFYKVDKTSDGYFAGFNAPLDPRIQNFECSNSGFADIRRHQGARQVRIPQLMEKYKGRIDNEIAKTILADHYDVYLEKENPCSRTICSHYELDDRKYMSQSGRPVPFQPRGAVDGVTATADDAERLILWARFGSSCGTPFIADNFLKKHPQFEYLRPFLKDRPRQPWTDFRAKFEKS